MIRILIVAAYASVRAGLHALLADTEDCQVVGQVSGSDELEQFLPQARPDVVLCDDNEADRGRLLAVLEETPIGLVLLSDDPGVPRLLAAGAFPGWSCLRKEADGPEIAGAARAVAAGLVALESALARQLLAAHASSSPAEAETSNGVLTSREREVLQLMAEGLPNKVIAARLHISQHTVKFHVASILTKLGASSRTEAVTLGVRHGYILL